MINEQVAIIARNAVETTLQLLMICEMKYGKAIVKPMSQKFRRLLNLWYYNGEPTHSPEIFAREIHEAEDTLFTVMENANCKMSAALPTRTGPEYEVSVKSAAEALLVSENTIRNWDANGCPVAPTYPGRFKSPVFFQWAQAYKSMRNFDRQAKKRAILMNCK